MKKTFKNTEIEKILTALENEKSFVNDISVKLPKSVRHALRVNLHILMDRYKIYAEEKQAIITAYVERKEAVISDDGTIKITDINKAKDFMDELDELGESENTLEIEELELSYFDNVDLSLSEDEAIELLFAKDKED